MTEDKEHRAGLDIDWAKTLAGALAAMTSAVLLSTLGAVGTLIGAAVGSIAATVGTAIYAQGLARSKRAVVKAQESALSRIGVAEAAVRRAQSTDTRSGQVHLERAEGQLADARAELEEVAEAPEVVEDPEQPGWRDRLAALPWKRIAVLAAGTFLIVMLVILAFELLSGRSVSSLTGGSDDRRTTIFGGNVDESDPPRERSPEQQPSESVTEGPSEEPSDTDTETAVPSETLSEEPTEETTPTETPTTPASTPTVTPTG